MLFQRRAFTIIELMIVVGIIAIAMAFILPALSAGRQVARTAKCKSNSRQAVFAALLDSDRINLFTNFYPTYQGLADTDVLECPDDLTPGVLPVTATIDTPLASGGSVSASGGNSAFNVMARRRPSSSGCNGGSNNNSNNGGSCSGNNNSSNSGSGCSGNNNNSNNNCSGGTKGNTGSSNVTTTTNNNTSTGSNNTNTNNSTNTNNNTSNSGNSGTVATGSGNTNTTSNTSASESDNGHESGEIDSDLAGIYSSYAFNYEFTAYKVKLNSVANHSAKALLYEGFADADNSTYGSYGSFASMTWFDGYKVSITHIDQHNSRNAQKITCDVTELSAHLAHGDAIGNWTLTYNGNTAVTTESLKPYDTVRSDFVNRHSIGAHRGSVVFLDGHVEGATAITSSMFIYPNGK